MEIGIDSFAVIMPDPTTGKPPSPADRIAALLEEVETADRVGLDVFGIGEHHRAEFLDSAPAIILAAAAARTSRIRLTSAVTVLSAADPVRVFQEFATLGLIARGRAEIVVLQGQGNWPTCDSLGLDEIDMAVALQYVDFPYPHDWRAGCPLLSVWAAEVRERLSLVRTQPVGFTPIV